ncbi:DUF4346 domain-containing protein [Candidatus Woesearchaeota archaeon]|nr:DUF4346 domain-containing protein [Candidatus Woesearchaeota archaeon]MCF7901199.1 DUF4346 domain-containing protein [Candidatus Woesearchaeota archaeon]MCF8013706.1 DUF4346 domain-containing protein [Candidatus Woesearchaeota archaeon]
MNQTEKDKWPVYYADTVHLSNKESNVGIVCLWTKKERIIEKLIPENYCFIGQLYSKDYGLQILIRNLLANNQIRYLVVTGLDLNKSAQGLINFFELGVDETNKILDTEIFLDSKIKKEHVDIIRDRVCLVDLRNTNLNDLNEELLKLNKLNGKGEEIIIDLPDIKPPIRYPTDFSGFKIRGMDFFRAYRYLLKNILRFGIYDGEKKEVFIGNVSFFIEKLTDDDSNYLSKRISNVWESKFSKKFNYEDKEYETFFIDELDCSDEIKDAVMSMFAESKKNICFMIGKAYLPEKYLEDAVEIVGNNISKKWLPDPHGNVVIRVEDNLIRAMHVNQKGKAIDEFTGKTAKEVYRKIASNIAISMIYHALDIGAELQKAEIALMEGKKYVQDRPL